MLPLLLNSAALCRHVAMRAQRSMQLTTVMRRVQASGRCQCPESQRATSIDPICLIMSCSSGYLEHELAEVRPLPEVVLERRDSGGGKAVHLVAGALAQRLQHVPQRNAQRDARHQPMMHERPKQDSCRGNAEQGVTAQRS